MKVLVGCEFSGVVREAFRARGHDAWSCDLLPAEDRSPYHFQNDILELLRDCKRGIYPVDWDLLIAHPPCTYLCNSGVSWLESREGRWKHLLSGGELFRKLMSTDIPKVAVENPIPHKYALQVIGRKYDQIIQPWMFGHGETKSTCLWLKNLPKLKPTNIVSGRENRIHRMPPSPERARERSRTYKGIAEAMAEQWG